MKCANCPADAIYSLVEPRVSPVHYCGKCLPKHLRLAASAGQLPLYTGEQPPIGLPVGTFIPTEGHGSEPAPKKRRKAKTAAPSATTPTVSADDLSAAIDAGYDSAATDGDGDGLVQDGTAFERPVGDVLTEYSEETSEEGA